MPGISFVDTVRLLPHLIPATKADFQSGELRKAASFSGFNEAHLRGSLHDLRDSSQDGYQQVHSHPHLRRQSMR